MQNEKKKVKKEKKNEEGSQIIILVLPKLRDRNLMLRFQNNKTFSIDRFSLFISIDLETSHRIKLRIRGSNCETRKVST